MGNTKRTGWKSVIRSLFPQPSPREVPSIWLHPIAKGHSFSFTFGSPPAMVSLSVFLVSFLCFLSMPLPPLCPMLLAHYLLWIFLPHPQLWKVSVRLFKIPNLSLFPARALIDSVNTGNTFWGCIGEGGHFWRLNAEQIIELLS